MPKQSRVPRANQAQPMPYPYLCPAPAGQNTSCTPGMMNPQSAMGIAAQGTNQTQLMYPNHLQSGMASQNTSWTPGVMNPQITMERAAQGMNQAQLMPYANHLHSGVASQTTSFSSGMMSPTVASGAQYPCDLPDTKYLSTFISTGEVEIRLLFNGRIRHITVKQDTFSNEEVVFYPLLRMPALLVDPKWTKFEISRSEGDQMQVKSFRHQFVGVTNNWHSVSIDCLQLELGPFHTQQVHDCVVNRPFFLAQSIRLQGIVKLALAEYQIPALERETLAYELLHATGITPGFLGHVTEHGRIIGFMAEKLDGHMPVKDNEYEWGLCLAALHRLHAHNITLHDMNLSNFLIVGDEAKIISLKAWQFIKLEIDPALNSQTEPEEPISLSPQPEAATPQTEVFIPATYPQIETTDGQMEAGDTGSQTEMDTTGPQTDGNEDFSFFFDFKKYNSHTEEDEAPSAQTGNEASGSQPADEENPYSACRKLLEEDRARDAAKAKAAAEAEAAREASRSQTEEDEDPEELQLRAMLEAAFAED